MNRGFPPIIIANWKMNGLLLESMRFLKELRAKIHQSLVGCEIVICPPYTLLRDMAEKVPGTGIKLGGQDCHHLNEGPYTGEISAAQLADMMCDYVILGHSERRIHNNEGSEIVRKKIIAAHQKKLTAILCIGETQYERENTLMNVVLREQLVHSIPECANAHNTIIAYEPVWAIGTGVTPTAEQITQAHLYITEVIRDAIPSFEGTPRVIYGGSVNEENAAFLLKTPQVDGLLVGKSSLDAQAFWHIISSVS